MAKVPPTLAPDLDAWIALKLDGLQYGALTLKVHDGRVVEIEKTEKDRKA